MFIDTMSARDMCQVYEINGDWLIDWCDYDMKTYCRRSFNNSIMALFNEFFSCVFTVDNGSKPVIQPHTVHSAVLIG